MAGKGNATIYQKILKSKMFFVFLIPVSLALITGISQKFYYRYEIKKEVDKLNAEIASLNGQKKELNNLLDYYKSESSLEKEARIRLNLKKEGEKVIIILPQATSTDENNQINSATAENSSEVPNYKQWWYYFFEK